MQIINIFIWKFMQIPYENNEKVISEVNMHAHDNRFTFLDSEVQTINPLTSISLG